jgi:hypothetical protein
MCQKVTKRGRIKNGSHDEKKGFSNPAVIFESY